MIVSSYFKLGKRLLHDHNYMIHWSYFWSKNYHIFENPVPLSVRYPWSYFHDIFYLQTLFSIIQLYNTETMILYCPMVVATVLNIWCSVARLLHWLPPVYHFLPATGTLYIYDKMLWSYVIDIRWNNSHDSIEFSWF